MKYIPMDIGVRMQSALHLAQADKELLREMFWPSKSEVQRYAAAEGRDWRAAYISARLSTLWPAFVVATGIAMAPFAVHDAWQSYKAPAQTQATDTLETKLDTLYLR
jgi:hypothetical protein